MKTLLYQWVKANSVMLFNAGSLVGTTAVTSILGFAYWWLAARQFPPEIVGVAAASISAMMLLGIVCMLGLGTLLIGELPRQPGREMSLINTALIIVGVVGGGSGIIFALVAPYLSSDLQILRSSVTDIALFAIGVSLTSITLVFDQAVIGLLRGDLQLWRNTLFAAAKLIALFIVSFWLSHTTGMSIYATWVIGNVLSLAALFGYSIVKHGWPRRALLPQWGLLRNLGKAALQHHLLNLTLQAPTFALPVLVTALLSARVNAWFYASWMIACFVFVVPTALTTVLYATNAASSVPLKQAVRMTVSLALVASVVANSILLFDTQQVLGVFGPSYAEQATWCLRILGLAAFPLIIKNHYIALCRIQDRAVQAMFITIPSVFLELAAAGLGGYFGGLSGLSLGWTIAVGVESVCMLRTVYQVIRPVEYIPLGAHQTVLQKDSDRHVQEAYVTTCE